MLALKSLLWRSLAAATVLAVAGCQTLPATTAGSSAAVQAALARAPQLRQDLFQGIYEVVLSPSADGLFVATTPSFDAARGGLVYRLDPRTLQPLQTLALPRKAFALGLNSRTRTLYVGNTVDGSITVLDASSGEIKGVIQLAQPEQGEDGTARMPHTRKVIVDEARNRVFVTNPSRNGKVWIVDGEQGTLRHTVQVGMGTVGAEYDPGTNRLYVGGNDEILVIDPDTGRILTRHDADDGEKHFFINLALDTRNQRLFATDPNSNQVYVFDLGTDQVLHHMAVHGVSALDIVYNAPRGEIIATSRGVSQEKPQGTGAVTIFDATSYAIKRVIDLPVHPNSLALSLDGQTLYVTVKAASDKAHPAWREDARASVVRIDL